MSHLRKYLERHGILGPGELEAGLRRQLIYGGSFDTCLLELELVDPREIGDLLSRACGLPPAPDSLIESGLERPWASVPAELVDTGWIIPLYVNGPEVTIAVHPDLPDEKLGALYRSVPGMRPMVVPECCIARLAAERTGSVMPQRYAVLNARFAEAVSPPAPPSSPSDPTIPDGGDGDVQPSGEPTIPDGLTVDPEGGSVNGNVQESAEPTIPDGLAVDPERGDVDGNVQASAEPTIPDGLVVDPEGLAPPEPGSSARDDTAVPVSGEGTWPPPDTAWRPADATWPGADTTAPPAPPPEAEPWTGVGAAPEPRAVDAQALRDAVAPYRKALAQARERNAATEALARCAMAVSPRVALFGVKHDGLLALRTPCERIAVPEHTLIPVRDDSDLDRVLAGKQVMDRLADLDLRLAIGQESAIPCVFEGVRVRGRNVLMLYVDRDGEVIHPAEAEILREVCGVAGTTLEAVLKLRRAQLSSDAATTGPRSPAPPAGHGPRETPAQEGWKPPAAIRRKKAAEEQDVQSEQPGLWIPPLAEAASQAPPVPDAMTPPPSPGPAPASGEPLTLTATISPEPPPVRSEATEAGHPTPAQLAFQPPPPPPFRRSAESELEHDDTVPAPPREQPPQLQLPPLVGADAPPLPRMVQSDTTHRGPTLGLPGTTPTQAAPLPPRGTPTEQRLPGPPVPYQSSDKETDFADLIDDGPKVPTIDASPPPPVLPPPPAAEMGAAGRPKTLSGLPPDPTSSPPPQAGEDVAEAPLPPESQIVSLSSPIAESPPRARVELDEEDRVGSPRTDEDDARIDRMMDDLRVGKDVTSELASMGPRAMERLTKRFPGPLEVLRRDLGALPPPSAHGPLLRAAIALADLMVPHLLELFDNASPDVRFYAAFVFQELRDGRCMEPMATLAFDPDAEVRIIAMRVLETYNRTLEFDKAVEIVRAELRGKNRTRQLHAARAVGTLRDVVAIEPLIDLLSSKDRFTQEAALESLCSVTGQQHGLKPHRWRQWYSDYGGAHRVEWIVESLRHKDLPVRRWAYDELLRVTGHRIEFQPSGDRREREAASRAWMEWWVSEGRELLTPTR